MLVNAHRSNSAFNRAGALYENVTLNLCASIAWKMRDMFLLTTEAMTSKNYCTITIYMLN